jgi:hypothetical protein
MHCCTCEIVTSCGNHGPLRSGYVGPNSATIGVATAPAMCSGPVSPEMISRALRARPTRSLIVVGGDNSAAPEDAAMTAAASDSSPGPHNTTDARPSSCRIAAATAPNRSGGQRLFGQAAPGLINA